MHLIPLWIKLAYTAFLCVLVPVWLWKGPVTNFLWFSDIAAVVAGVAVWRESALLASTMALAVLLPEASWNVSFFVRLLTGRRFGALPDYMFDARQSRFVRGLSLVLHTAMPALLLYLVIRLGYDGRALVAQTLVAWIVLPVTFLTTAPADNVNWVFGLGGRPQHRIPALAYLALEMIGFPVLIYLPTHLLLQRALS